jgi:hypothetical protein
MAKRRKTRTLFEWYGLRPEPIIGVYVADLPGSEPVIAIAQASNPTPVYLALNLADQFATRLAHAHLFHVAGDVRAEMAKANARR